MTDTLSANERQTSEAPQYPMARAQGCPFDPPPALRDEQRKGPLTKVRLWDGSRPWLVTRYAEQRALLADPRVSADVTNPGYPSPSANRSNGLGFILMDDPEHARLRRMVTAPFTIKRTEALRPRVQQIVDDLIDEMLAAPKPVDLVQAFALPVPSLVICDLLGVPYADHDFFQKNSNTIINRNSTDEQRGGAVGALAAYLDRLVGEKLDRPEEDVTPADRPRSPSVPH